jgi:tetratricopeptide (TPR) repeat protein
MAAQPFYLHALRYEGRFMAAKAATSALHAAKYRQISKIRVEQIRKKKMQADRHFFLEDFTKAISMYQECLDIDPKVLSLMSDCDFEEVTSRDCCVRVHVILYYRLAACFMSLQKWEAAICELNKVLTIYPFFLNAIFCRCRCYSCLNRLQMAISDCELWLRLVREAKEVHIPASDVRKAKKVNVPTPVCAYDVGGPNDISAHDLTLVQEEWNNLQKKLDSSKEVVAKLPEKCTSHISLDCSADLATDSGEFYRKQAVIRLPDTFMQQTAESATMVSSDFTTFPVVEISSESSRRLNHDTRNVTEKAVICSADVQMKSKCNDDGQCAAVPETFKMATQFISSSMEADDTKLLVDDDAISISQTGPILAADSTENAIDSTKEMLLLSMKREISSMKFREELEIPDNDTSPLAFLKQEWNDLNVNHPLKEEVWHLVESPESEGTDLLCSYGLSSIISEKDIRLSKLDAGCQECNSKSKLVEDFVEVVPERGQLKDSVVEEKREKTPLCPLGDEGIDLIYLKCVVVQYLALPPLSMERKSLLPVLGALLQFEDGDYRRLGDGNDDPSREASSSWWSGLSGWEL